MYNEFDNKHTQPSEGFEDKLYNLLYPDINIGSTKTFYLELVKEKKTDNPDLWFVLTQKNQNIHTKELIEVTVKRLK